MHKTKQGGFTLLEMIVTVSITVILLSVGIPRFMGMVNVNRLSSNTNDFVQVLHLARSEAIRSGSATVCTSNNQASCTGTPWGDGWILMDGAGNVKRVYEGFANSLKMTTGGNAIAYGNNGFLNPVGVQNFTLCHVSGAGRLITIATSGRPSTEQAATC